MIVGGGPVGEGSVGGGSVGGVVWFLSGGCCLWEAG